MASRMLRPPLHRGHASTSAPRSKAPPSAVAMHRCTENLLQVLQAPLVGALLHTHPYAVQYVFVNHGSRRMEVGRMHLGSRKLA